MPPEMKIALGLFHFNPHWNGDPRSAHRHCTEALGPFLRILWKRPDWRVNIEISGSGLEFIHKSYPDQLRLLLALAERGQVELISSLYTPNIWVAFPRRDLLRSIAFNRECLERLGFKWSRMFFAQEAFFGCGVEALSDHFDFVICKDDYLSYQREIDWSNPCFRLGDMKVVVASNHLVNELARSFVQDAEFARLHKLSAAHVEHLKIQAAELETEIETPAARCRSSAGNWLWYHCGDGNYIGTIYKPDDLERCYYDPVWADLCSSQVDSYQNQGFRLAIISELTSATDYSTAQQLHPLLEGSWNPKNADGVFRWMGKNSTKWENDLGVLSAAARSRARLVRADQVAARIGSIGDSGACAGLHNKLDRGWRALLNAQVSDSLGWMAGARAVVNSLQYSDEALMLGTQVIEEGTAHLTDGVDIMDEVHIPPRSCVTHVVPWPTAQIFGGQGTCSRRSESCGLCLYECFFRQTEERCGVRFPFEIDTIVFCPSGLDEEPVMIPLSSVKTVSPTLPLANGLLQLADNLFVIKDIRFVHAAVRINRSSRTAEFATEGLRLQRQYEWRFFVVQGSLDDAVKTANSVNYV